MNYAPTIGWFYISINNRSAAWSGVEFLHNFIIGNKSVGPYGEETNRARIEVGDFVQLGDETGHFYHSPVVVGITPEEIFIAAHTYDAYMRPLSSYEYQRIRFIHILGARKYQ